MQPSQIQASLDAFLSGDDRVMVIRGAWGVGKTYFWSNYVSRRIEAQSLSQVAYSYVSLFGKSSLPDIRASIFQTGKPIAKDEAIKEQFEKEYQESTGLLKNVPWLQSAQEKIWAAAGFDDTLLRWKMKPEVVHGEKKDIQPRVQARGGQAGHRAWRGCGPGSQGPGRSRERAAQVGS